MHLFMAREMVDRTCRSPGAMVDPRSTLAQKLAALPKMLSFYAWWYPTRWLGWGLLAALLGVRPRSPRHLRFVERMSRKLARESFHGMAVYQAGLQNKQAFLFRLVDVANELFAMAASISPRAGPGRHADAGGGGGGGAGGRVLPHGARAGSGSSSTSCGTTTTSSATARRSGSSTAATSGSSAARSECSGCRLSPPSAHSC